MAGCGQAPADADTVEAAGAVDVAANNLTVDFTSCREFAGIGFVPAENARPLVPAHYTLAGDATSAVIVARVAQCADSTIDRRRVGPGTLAQIGISLVGPDTTADINNYTLWYTTTSRALAAGLLAHGIRAEVDDDLRFKVDATTGALTASDAPRRAPAFHLGGVAVPPTADPVPFTASWWQDGERRVATMRTTFPEIAFGTSTTTLTTPSGSALARLIGDTSLGFPLLDSYNQFATAHMVQPRLVRD